MGIAPGSLLLEYRESQKLAAKDYSFYGLIMAAMRRADTRNLEILQNAWPKVYEALEARYNAPGGLLPGEGGKYSNV